MLVRIAVPAWRPWVVRDALAFRSNSWVAPLTTLNVNSLDAHRHCFDYSEIVAVCQLLERHQFAPDSKLQDLLHKRKCADHLCHEFVLNVLNRFLRDRRRPAWRFFLWAAAQPGYNHNSKTYNKIIDILGKAKQFNTIWELLQEMGDRRLLNLKTLEISVKAFASAREMKKAVRIFDLATNYMYDVDVAAFNFILEALSRAKLGEEGFIIFKKLKQTIPPNAQTYGILLSGLCRANNVAQAVKVWNEMVDQGFDPHVTDCNTMLEALFKGKRHREALELFYFIHPNANTSSYAIVIDALCNENQIEQALKLFHEMKENGCPPDDAVYKCLIMGLGDAKKVEEACGMLEEINLKGPNIGCYNALIKVMVNRRRPDEATRLFREMIENGCEPTMHTYIMLLQVHFGVRGGQMSRGGCCPDINFHTVFVGGLVKAGRSQEASKYLESIIYKGIRPPRFDYNKFLGDFSTPGRLHIFEELAEKMRQAGMSDVSDVFLRFSQKMTTREKRRGVPSHTIG